MLPDADAGHALAVDAGSAGAGRDAESRSARPFRSSMYGIIVQVTVDEAREEEMRRSFVK